MALAECPHVDVNWQDSEGNTALITAAQAGKSWPSFSSRVLLLGAVGSCDSRRHPTERAVDLLERVLGGAGWHAGESARFSLCSRSSHMYPLRQDGTATG